jgi:hypothetical protein
VEVVVVEVRILRVATVAVGIAAGVSELEAKEGVEGTGELERDVEICDVDAVIVVLIDVVFKDAVIGRFVLGEIVTVERPDGALPMLEVVPVLTVYVDVRLWCRVWPGGVRKALVNGIVLASSEVSAFILQVTSRSSKHSAARYRIAVNVSAQQAGG